MRLRQASYTRGLLVLSIAVVFGCDDPSKSEPAPHAAPSASAVVARALTDASSSAQTPTSALAPVEAPPGPPAWSAADRAQILADAAKQVEDRYVSPELGTLMASAIRQKADRGGYDAVTTPADLARVVTADLLAGSHDPRVTLEYEPAPRPFSSDEQHRAARDSRNRTTGGFGVGGRLPGNVERLVLESFEPVDDVRAAVEEHLTHAADADALLIDLRDNSGGDPATVALVASYIFDGPRLHLDDTWWRSTGATEASWTVPSPPGKRFGGKKPVVVLTSARTSSAGEELAYDLQAMHRAVVVGEKTAGVAHPVAPQKLAPGFTLRVPIGRVINHVTHKDWEGVGVTPDVQATATDALKTGYIRALRAVIAGPGITEATRRGLKSALLALGEQ